ncbi:PLP-dependent aminotransferase family protein [Pseudonocardia kujensis]|uniref:aminotransferase-like domain-containing protein n=1 Tax=Pseudonocardia kujensis TaxID=1128675 RepID=UPI001E293065|nr:PLP-dependent aminotransferase family protein [Pseudonocardia kujensis]MCE0767940.1 PLP-dependent aminotransferase family protein [Pseudonocardia kujensis]
MTSTDLRPPTSTTPAGSPPVALAARLAGIRGSAIRDLLTLTARDDVLSLAGGLPAADLMPRERIAAAADRALRSPAAVQYSETAGLAELREVVAAHETGRTGRAVAPADVVVTSGSQQALDLLARALLDPGDPVAVEDPVYVGALQVLQAAGAEVHPVPLDADGMRVDVLATRLEAGFRPRLVHTVSSFHNPRGVTMGQERRRALAELAERYGFLVVEDDPYGLLAFDGAPPRPLAAHGERVVRLGSASKVLAPSLRVGWLVAPPVLAAAVERLKQSTDLCGSSLTQMITAELLADEEWFAAHVEGVRRENRVRAAALTAAVDAEFGAAVRRSTPTGGMFCWLEFTDGTDTARLLPIALEHGVGFVPGAAFSVHGAAEGGSGLRSAARLCFATYPPDVLTEAVRRLAGAAAGRTAQ